MQSFYLSCLSNSVWSPRIFAQSDEICIPTRIYGPAGFVAPDAVIHADYIAYTRGKNARDVIYLYQISTGTLAPLMPNQHSHIVHDIYDDYVVWSHGDGQDTEITLYQPGTGTFSTVTDNEIDDLVIEVHGDFILAANSNNDIYLYQISTGQITTLVESQVAWTGIDPTGFISNSYHGNVLWFSPWT